MLLLIEKIILVLQVTLIFKVLIKMTSNHYKRKMELEAMTVARAVGAER